MVMGDDPRRPVTPGVGPGTTGTEPTLGGTTPAAPTPAAGRGPEFDAGYQAALAEFSRRHIRTPETKEFFKTSEFLAWLAGVAAILIASGVSEEFDVTWAWRLVTFLSMGYILSRGLSKAGARRDDRASDAGLDATGLAADRGPTITTGRLEPAGAPVGGGTGSSAASDFVGTHIRTPETKEFFKTSEFLVWAAAVAAILIASAIADRFDGDDPWWYVTLVSIAYILSRGLSKAATRRDDYDRDERYGGRTEAAPGATGGGAGVAESALRHVRTPETKEFFKTSEFFLWMAAVAAILIASSALDTLDAPQAWEWITYVTIAYVVSRGLAKIGARRGDTEPR